MTDFRKNFARQSLRTLARIETAGSRSVETRLPRWTLTATIDTRIAATGEETSAVESETEAIAGIATTISETEARARNGMTRINESIDPAWKWRIGRGR